MNDASESLTPLQRALLALERLEARLEAAERAKTEPIAIVGMGCRFPGGADSPAAYWRLLEAGIDAVTRVPERRWRPELLEQSGLSAEERRAARWGAFIEEVDAFDAGFFGISPREAASMDPQQRLLLEVSWEALEHANIVPGTLAGTRTGVFLGITSCDYQQLMLNGPAAGLDVHTATGNGHCFPPGRLSYLLGLEGPSLAVDTACSSSLVALHLAVQSLRLGECDLALVGGVNLLLSPVMTWMIARMQALSPDGRCRAFDARANGFVRGEGCGVVVLKRQRDALEAGQPVLASIRGSAVNQDGRSSALTAPNVQAQQAVIRQALENARVPPEAVSYVETHGTGTPLGDPIEIEALSEALGTPRADGSSCWLGSVKTNLGHLEAAAGIAGLIKVVLALQHERIPRHLHFQRLNPRITLNDAVFSVPATGAPWPRGTRRRYAGLSSFGMSGTNAHVVLEEAPASPAAGDARPPRGSRRALSGPFAESAPTAGPLYVLALSAPSAEALPAQARRWASFLADVAVDLPGVCVGANLGRTHHRHRAAVMGRTTAELRALLDGLAIGQVPDGCLVGEVEPGRRPRVAFLYGGQGALYAGMGRGLYEGEPVFREAFERCERLVAARTGTSLVDALCKAEPGTPLLEPCIVQAGIFALQHALTALLASWGIAPDGLLGDSLGQHAAACAAGTHTLDEALERVIARARLLETRAEPEAMVATTGHLEQARFAEGVRRLRQEGVTVWLELGSESMLLPAVQREAGRGEVLIPCLRRERAADEVMRRVAALLHVHGVRVDWRAVYPECAPLTGLPGYVFQRQRLWAAPPYRPGGGLENADQGLHPLLGRRFHPAVPQREIVFESSVRADPGGLMDQHRVAGAGVLPLAAWIELALAAGAEVLQCAQPALTDLAIHQPLRLEDAEVAALQTVLVLAGPGSAELRVFSREPSNGTGWSLHAQGRLIRPDAPVSTRTTRPDDPVSTRTTRPDDPVTLDALLARAVPRAEAGALYDLFAKAGLRQGPELRGLEALYAIPGGGLGRVVLPVDVVDASRYRWHPALLDACLQVVLALLLEADPTALYLPVTLESATFARAPGRQVWSEVALHPAPTGAQTRRADVRIYDHAGLVGALEGLVVRRTDTGTLRARGPLETRDDLYAVEYLERAPDPGAAKGLEAARWLIVADGLELAEPLARQLADRGARCATVRIGGNRRIDRSGATTQVQLEDATPVALSWLFGELERDEDGATARPLHIVVLRGDEQGHGPHSGDIIDRISAGCLLIVRTTQAVAASRLRAARLWLVTRGSATAGDGSPTALSACALHGLMRTLALEHPELRPVSIDLDPVPSADDLAQLLREMDLGGGESEVALRKGRRLHASLQRLATDDRAGGAAISGQSSYLITGGAGALGMRVAGRLHQLGARHLVLVGRRPPGATEQVRIRAWQQAGVEVRVLEADIGRAEEVARVLEAVRTSLPPLRGIVHAAGALADAVVLNLTPAQLQETLAGKAGGAWHLHRLTTSLPLDFFVMFSSAAAVLGAPGQAAYAAANAFLDGLARHRRAEGLPALTISWGPWAAEGMASRNARSLERWAAQGIDALEPERALAALELLLGRGVSHAVVVPVNWARYLSSRPYPSALFDAVVTPDTKEEAGIRARLEQIGPHRARALLLEYVRAEVARVLGLPAPAQVPADRAFSELGLDSLGSLELRGQLQKALGCALKPSLVFDHPTLDALVGHLMQVTADGSDGPQVRAEAGAEDAEATARLDALSDLELGELLDRRLADLEDRPE